MKALWGDWPEGLLGQHRAVCPPTGSPGHEADRRHRVPGLVGELTRLSVQQAAPSQLPAGAEGMGHSVKLLLREVVAWG